jgi:hypothetical protein
MRTLSIYSFSELSKEARKKAIIGVREELKENTPHDLVFDWAIDNCELFEPSEQDMRETFGDQYADDLGNDFLMKNLRTGITHKNGNLNVTQALRITNQEMFKTWIGFPKIFHRYVECSIIGMDEDPSTLDVEVCLAIDDPREGPVRSLIEIAEKNFETHMTYVERKIINGISEYFSDDNLTETISANDRYEFLEDGTLYNS